MNSIPTPIKNALPPTDLLKSDFWYDLPKEYIAQSPVEPRDSSRLMTVSRKGGEIGHHIFRDILSMLSEGDVLVINESRVIPARLLGVKRESGITMETLLLRQRSPSRWETLLRPGRRAKDGTVIDYPGGLYATVIGDSSSDDDGVRVVEFSKSGAALYAEFDRIGTMPLPPYITEKLSDRERYQTVYAKTEGSSAAPTAGLHFTPTLLEAIRAKGVKIVSVLLHVGLGTFRPVKEDRITDHIMHSEYFEVSDETADTINSRTGRLIAVGTTSCRTLESAADECGKIRAMSGDTGIFIYPGYRFKAIEGLITNFHLPESTLLMLVSAFASREIMLSAYKVAIHERYRFFSFGDAMFIS